MKLNPAQMEAVNTIQGPLLVFAGAGSGKTRVITNRIAHMIQNKEISAGRIVALSFTNKSAKELSERLRKMVPREKLKGIILSTFHSLGLRILKEHITKLGYHETFLLFNGGDQESFVSELLKIKKIDPKKVPPKEILRRISYAKNTMGLSRNASLDVSEEFSLIAQELFPMYEEGLKEKNAIDFDDLILLPKRILHEFPEVAEAYHKKYQYFLVDEFQDTNQLQYEFLSLFRGKSDNLCVVGDDDQSIYAFRGSNVELILNFEREFPHAKIVRLLENYRSTQPIIEAAHSLIKNNKGRKEKQLFSRIQSDENVEYYETADEKEEAIFVASRIQSVLIKNEFQGNEIAILFRTNFQSRPFEEELRNRNIPYKVVGGYNFFDRKEVRDCICYLRYVANPKDDYSLLRIINYPKRGIGPTTVNKLQEEAFSKGISIFDVFLKIVEDVDYLTEVKTKVRQEIYHFVELVETFKKKFSLSPKLAPVLKEMITQIGFEREISIEESDEKVSKARIFNLSELVNMLAFFENEEREEKPKIFDFLQRLALMMEDEPKEEEKDRRVQLLTMHQSKGLEYDLVFLVGLEEGILPNSRVIEEGEAVDEERRLLYVGMTRPRRKLYLTAARSRRKFGEQIASDPSRFIKELSRDVVLYFPLEKEDREAETLNFLEELEKLKVG
ncbi:ATP-dependent helicase [Leptospira ilyithenensis]|uniref:DNA 3'-5' helicase n=1 Tax=Leptospira ilyithenensis TaxID=2484901 RepID=A0A4R9LLV5_9LEPT|nr:UvrD-helicase domain-containing protein [Leptospira ilyithenensis]TGN07924.1 damage-inducible protein [Leptospira ilyithenensis]